MPNGNSQFSILNSQLSTLNSQLSILNFCDKREQLSLLKLPSKAKILSEAKNSQFSILNS